ncbi:MAG TPA: MarR family transcriptional regulator [Ktedonobacterales bacterium]|nr:MarR family transcriptional regulator [Ktedonobacterales bacterium]
MTEKIDEFHLAAWRAFLNAHAVVIDLIERDLAETDLLPLSSYDVLIELAEAPDHRLRMHELARAVVLSRSGLTRLVDRLEREGLLTRERADTDRRGAYAVITTQGLQAVRRTWPKYAQSIMRYFTSHLSDEETRILTTALERVFALACQEYPS